MLKPSLRRVLVAAVSAPVLALAVSTPSFGTGSTAAPSADKDSLTATPLTPTDTVNGHKAGSSRLARTPASLLGRTDTTPINVMVKYDYDATASYAGGVDNLAATSPRKTGKKLTGSSAAERAYTAYVQGRERAIAAGIQAAVPSATIGRSFRTVYGGVQATVPANEVADLLKVSGVVAVQPDELRQLLTDSSSDFVNASAVQASVGAPDGASDAGKGLIYANLDSGVWPEHPSFADQGNLSAPPATPARQCNFGDNPLTLATDVFECNNKLIGGYAFLNTYLSSPARAAAEPFHTARDSNGHGTHTSSTTAGNVLEHADLFGVDRGPIHGMAPGAWLISYKVCGIQGCYASDSAAAVDQAVLDGADVINFSISGGTSPFEDPVELAFLDAYAANVFVAASAGNSGPGASTANHLSPWVTTVAASTQTREFASTLQISAPGGASFEAVGASITAGAGPLPIVLSSAPPYSNPLCTAPAPAGLFEGKIVACQRGGNARVDKGFNVLQGGAEGMVLYNPTLADIETDSHWLPTVHLADGTSLVAFLTANPVATAAFTAGTKRDGQGDVMAAFSSRGPVGKVIKPDITAPGVQILAGDTPVMESPTSGPEGEYFQAIAGTSMSSPHVAGAALLVRAAHPTWTPGQIKSALMASAVTNVVKEDLTTPADAFDMGAGRIDVGAAAAVALVLDESWEDMFALGGSDVDAVHLNLPSINAPTMPGALTTTRTVTNASSTIQKIDVSAQSPSGTKITVSPSKFNLLPGASQTLTVTITSSVADGVQRFGTIVLASKSGGAALHLPVAFVPKQTAVSLSQSCTPTTIGVDATTTCTVTATNNSPTDAAVDLKTTVSKQLKVVSASGATVTGPRSVATSGTLQAASPGVPAVGPGALFGYIPLSAFDVPPIAVGDEDIVNFNVPAFSYTGRTFTRIGVDSNGYIVVGGGTAADNNCCNLPTGPSAAPPNNVLAPFWTDLDGTGASGIYATILTDGVDDWLVVEHQVHVYGTTDLRSFQTWIGLNGTQDISFAYAADQTDPNGQDYLVGAENSLGQGDMSRFLPTEDLRVTSSASEPAGSISYDVVLRGESRGSGTVTTELRSPTLPGVTVVRTGVTVS